ncbi:beta strand repeat-containing protein [Methanobrevibacter filiformis]|uniref:DUF11 domain-containing protein n=1 Tax=Methanobrevibacter filiformis TaxID=55758 RepID=A0A166AJR3_9EURY|nr:DUF11 domain-containing protein [Methanobrevibacter filiformis]KZX12123.1 hypothetical protein MBFIL_12100 [Methanobrevibacter filiformis]
MQNKNIMGLNKTKDLFKVLSHKILKISVLLSIIAILVLSFSTVNAADLTLTPSDSINSAINTVSSSGTDNSITLGSGTYNKSNDRNNNLAFSNKNLTIKSNGAANSTIIDGRDSGRLFHITGSNNIITFKNITFRNGRITGAYGGAIYSQGTNNKITIIGCIFENNKAGYGGAIYNSRGNTFNVTDSIFDHNNASTYGGGAIWNEGNFVVTGSNFTNNYGVYEGGAINIRGRGNLNVSKSIFISNYGGWGGAINNDYNTTLIMTNSTCINNTAIEGGAIDTDFQGNTTVINSTFVNNDASRGGAMRNIGGSYSNVIGSTFTNNTGNTGGAIYNENSSFKVENSSFIDNEAADGGAINNHHYDFTVKNSNFTGNTASYHGGAIYNDYNGFSVTGSNFVGNKAPSNGGGGIYNKGSNVIVNYNRFYLNTNYALLTTGSVNANFNWWGDNSNPTSHKVSGANINYWYVLELSLNNTFKTTVDATKNYNVNQHANLSYYLTLNTPTSNNPSLLPYFEVTVLLKNKTGIVNNITADIRTTNLTYDVLVTNSNNLHSINALSDDENVILAIEAEAVNYTVNVNIVKVANASVANVGDTVVYTITVSNNGSTDATGVVVSDNLDYSKLQFVNASSVSYNSVTGKWNVGGLAAGKSVSLNITVRVIGAGSIVNVANVTTNENNTGNPKDNVTVTVNGSVNVNIVKVANVSVASVGDTVLYTITVSNNGSTDATGVVVSDNLDHGKLQFVNASSVSYNSVTGKWNVGGLAAGKSVSLNITVRVTGAGAIVNVANVTTVENNTGNPKDNVTVNVNGSVNVNIVKVANVSVASVGDTVVYTITVSNNGLTNATGVVVSDNLDYGKLQFVNASSVSYNSVTGKWNVGGLAAGKSVSLNVTVRVIGAGSIVNVANVTTNENNTGNPKDNVTITTTGTVDVNIVKVANASVASVGDTVVYTITVINNGSTDATGGVVSDNLDYGKLQFVNASSVSYNSVTGKWNVGGLAAGKSVSLNITVRVIGAGSIVNVANVTTNENNTGNPKDNVTVNVDGSVNVNIVKVANVSVASVGGTVVYTITVSNNGSNDATGVVVSDNLDYTKLQFVNASSVSYNSDIGKWNVGSLAAGETVSLNITVRIIAAGTIVNIANVTTNENNKGNPKDNVTITTNGTVDVNIVKVANVSVANVGDTVVYTITVINNGLTNATGVVVTDGLDYSKLAFVNASSASYSSVTGKWNVGSLAAGETVSLNITVRIIGAGSIVNVANVTTTENNTGNPKDNVTIISNNDVNVSLTKVSNSTGTSYLGDNVQYTITVTNHGSTNATGVYVIDNLDYNKLQFVNAIPSIGSYDSNTGKWTIGNLQPGEIATLTINTIVINTGIVINTANVNTNETNINNKTNGTVEFNASENDADFKDNITKTPDNNNTNVVIDNNNHNNNPKITIPNKTITKNPKITIPNKTITKNPIKVKANGTMKKTGIPIIAIILVLSLLGLASIKRRRK